MNLAHLSLSDLKVLSDIAYKFSCWKQDEYAYWNKVQKDCEQEILSRVVGIWGEIKQN